MALGAHAEAGGFGASEAELGGSYRQLGLSVETALGGHSFGASYEHFDGVNIEHPVPGRSSSLRVAALSRLDGSTRLQIDGFVSHDDFWGGWYQLVHGRLTRQLGRVELTARLQYTSLGSFAGHSATDVGLSLRIPMSAPNPFGRRSHRVHGRVVNAVTGGAVPGVLVHLEDSHAITGADGGFRLSQSGSGPFMLNLDVSTLAVDLVPMMELPVEVGGGVSEPHSIEIPVAPAGELRGRFLLVERSGTLEAGPVSTVRPVPMAIIEISDSAGSLRTITNVAGRFIFPKIRPGKYRASVVFAELPRRYRVEKESYEFAVEPGGIASLEILATAGGGNIKIISAGELTARSGPLNQSEKVVAEPIPESQEHCALAEWATTEQTHRVATGESLSLLAQSYLGEAYLWPIIWGRNSDRISNPHHISIGLRINIPARRFDSERIPGRWTRYTYVAGDTPESVAERFFGLRDLWPLLVPSGMERAPDYRIRPNSTLTVPGLSVTELSREECSSGG